MAYDSYGMMILKMDQRNPLAHGILNEVKRKYMNYAIIVTGRPQTRKSTMAVQLATEIQPDFNMDTQLAVIDTKNYIRALRLAGLRRGSVVILDEFGVGMDHRSWYRFLNKALNYIFQTHGHKGIIVIVTTPYFKYVDSDTKILFNMYIETVKKDDRKRVVYARVELMEYNQKLNQIYYKFCRGRYADGSIKRLDMWIFHYPKQEILDAYFKISNRDKLDLGADLEQEALKQDRMKKRGHLFNADIYAKEIFDSICEGKSDFLSFYRTRTTVSMKAITNKWPIGTTRAGQVQDRVIRMLEPHGLVTDSRGVKAGRPIIPGGLTDISVPAGTGSGVEDDSSDASGAAGDDVEGAGPEE